MAMKPLKCSICGYETNAVSGKIVKIICAGCYKLNKDKPITLFTKESGLNETMMDVVREYNNLPEWMRIPENRKRGDGYEIRSYTDL